MRRRQKFQDLKAAGVLDQNPVALAERGINPFPPEGAATKPKTRGRCNKCGKDIGVGIYMHSKVCLGSLEDIPDWKMRQQIEAARKAKVDPEKKSLPKRFQRGFRYKGASETV